MTHYISPLYYSACCHTAMGMNAKRCPVCRQNLPYKTKARDVRLGDIVRAYDGAGYSAATVIDIDAGREVVRLFRPYVQTSDFATSDGLIPYLGFEDYEISFDNSVIMLAETSLLDVLKSETDEGRLLRAGTAGDVRLRELRNARVDEAAENLRALHREAK